MKRLNYENYWVTKKNSLVEASYSLSLNEQKIILILASLINPNDTEFNSVTFKATELADILGVVPEVLYRDLPFITENLFHKVVTIKEEDKLIQTAFLSATVYKGYEKGSGEITMEFSQYLKPYLLQLKESFTTYKLAYILDLDSKYSIRLYEILKSRSFTKRDVLIPLDELKVKLDVIENKAYNQFNNFKTRVLEQAIKEINQKTDILVSYEVGKTGRKIDRLMFKIKANPSKQEEVFEKGKTTPPTKIKQTNKSKDALHDQTDVFSFVKTTYGYMTKLEISDDEILTICELFNYDLKEFVKYRRFINRRIKNAIAHATDFVKRQEKYIKPKPVIRKEPSLKEIEIPKKELTEEESARNIARMEELKTQLNDFLNMK